MTERSFVDYHFPPPPLLTSRSGLNRDIRASVTEANHMHSGALASVPAGQSTVAATRVLFTCTHSLDTVSYTHLTLPTTPYV